MNTGTTGKMLLLAILLVGQPIQAQVNGSSGGGGPSRDDIKAICTEWLDKLTPLEKSFVEKKGGTYQSQEDFFKQMQIVIALEVGKSVMKINDPKSSCSNSNKQSELALLNEIREIWQSGFTTKKKCLGMFSKRYQHRGLLDSLIGIYCSKNGEQTKNLHEGK